MPYECTLFDGQNDGLISQRYLDHGERSPLYPDDANDWDRFASVVCTETGIGEIQYYERAQLVPDGSDYPQSVAICDLPQPVEQIALPIDEADGKFIWTLHYRETIGRMVIKFIEGDRLYVPSMTDTVYVPDLLKFRN